LITKTVPHKYPIKTKISLKSSQLYITTRQTMSACRMLLQVILYMKHKDSN